MWFNQEKENQDLLDRFQMLHHRAEDWEVKAHQAEGESSSVRLELLSIDTERRHLRERVELLEKEIQEVGIFICLVQTLFSKAEIIHPHLIDKIQVNGNLLSLPLRISLGTPLLFYCSQIDITSNLPF